MAHMARRAAAALVASALSVAATFPAASRPVRWADEATSRQAIMGRGSQPSPLRDNFLTVDNGIVQMGVDLSRGGSIGFFGPSGPAATNRLVRERRRRRRRTCVR
jgi:hypothetical protein